MTHCGKPSPPLSVNSVNGSVLIVMRRENEEKRNGGSPSVPNRETGITEGSWLCFLSMWQNLGNGAGESGFAGNHAMKTEDLAGLTSHPHAAFSSVEKTNRHCSEAQMESVQLKKAPIAEASQKAQPPRFESIPSVFLRLRLSISDRAGCTTTCTRRCGKRALFCPC